MKIVKDVLVLLILSIIVSASLVLGQDVTLWVSDVTDTSVEISISNPDSSVYGFQFNIIDYDGVLVPTFGAASGGLAAQNGFAVSTNADGLVLGFSFTGGFIPAGEGVLTTVAWTPGGIDGYLDIDSPTISGSGGSSLNTVTGDPFCYGSCAPIDCNGVAGGGAYIDDCGYCVGGDTGLDENYAMDCAGVCDGAAVEDCLGVCGGDAIVDECGVCEGSGIPEGECDCDGNVEDCLGVCGGDAVVDECGVCDGPGIPEGECDCDGNVEDCLGVCGGDAVVDECGVCDGTGIPEGECDCDGNVEDCNGECGGTAVIDDCGDCVDPVDFNQAMDCNSVCDGEAYLDGCSDCVGGDTGLEPCANDCAGVPDGEAFWDDCGVCSGGTSEHEANSDMDCYGDCPEGTPSWDGDLGGTAFENECGCVEGNTGLLADFCYGCTDETACNYDATMLIDDDSCTYPEDEYHDCAGGCIVDIDCAGVCNGSAQMVDYCFDYDGDGLGDNTNTGNFCDATVGNGWVTDCSDEDDNCMSNVHDCAGVCDGTAVEDCTGTCGGTAEIDCAGECGGFAIEDCAGECNGDSYLDDCGDCDNDPDNDNDSCTGCMDPNANNYDPNATIHNWNLCEYDAHVPFVGIVNDDSGNPIEGASVTVWGTYPELRDVFQPITEPVMTDQEGGYIVSVPADYYLGFCINFGWDPCDNFNFVVQVDNLAYDTFVSDVFTPDLLQYQGDNPPDYVVPEIQMTPIPHTTVTGDFTFNGGRGFDIDDLPQLSFTDANGDPVLTGTNDYIYSVENDQTFQIIIWWIDGVTPTSANMQFSFAGYDDLQPILIPISDGGNIPGALITFNASPSTINGTISILSGSKTLNDITYGESDQLKLIVPGDVDAFITTDNFTLNTINGEFSFTVPLASNDPNYPDGITTPINMKLLLELDGYMENFAIYSGSVLIPIEENTTYDDVGITVNNPIPVDVEGSLTFNGGHGETKDLDLSVFVDTTFFTYDSLVWTQDPIDTMKYAYTLSVPLADIVVPAGGISAELTIAHDDYEVAASEPLTLLEGNDATVQEISLDPKDAVIGGVLSIHGGTATLDTVAAADSYTLLDSDNNPISNTIEWGQDTNGDKDGTFEITVPVVGIGTPLTAFLEFHYDGYFETDTLEADLYENQTLPQQPAVFDLNPKPAVFTGTFGIFGSDAGFDEIELVISETYNGVTTDISSDVALELFTDEDTGEYTGEFSFDVALTDIDLSVLSGLSYDVDYYFTLADHFDSETTSFTGITEGDEFLTPTENSRLIVYPEITETPALITYSDDLSSDPARNFIHNAAGTNTSTLTVRLNRDVNGDFPDEWYDFSNIELQISRDSWTAGPLSYQFSDLQWTQATDEDGAETAYVFTFDPSVWSAIVLAEHTQNGLDAVDEVNDFEIQYEIFVSVTDPDGNIITFPSAPDADPMYSLDLNAGNAWIDNGVPSLPDYDVITFSTDFGAFHENFRIEPNETFTVTFPISDSMTHVDEAILGIIAPTSNIIVVLDENGNQVHAFNDDYSAVTFTLENTDISHPLHEVHFTLAINDYLNDNQNTKTYRFYNQKTFMPIGVEDIGINEDNDNETVERYDQYRTTITSADEYDDFNANFSSAQVYYRQLIDGNPGWDPNDPGNGFVPLAGCETLLINEGDFSCTGVTDDNDYDPNDFDMQVGVNYQFIAAVNRDGSDENFWDYLSASNLGDWTDFSNNFAAKVDNIHVVDGRYPEMVVQFVPEPQNVEEISVDTTGVVDIYTYGVNLANGNTVTFNIDIQATTDDLVENDWDLYYRDLACDSGISDCWTTMTWTVRNINWIVNESLLTGDDYEIGIIAHDDLGQWGLLENQTPLTTIAYLVVDHGESEPYISSFEMGAFRLGAPVDFTIVAGDEDVGLDRYTLEISKGTDAYIQILDMVLEAPLSTDTLTFNEIIDLFDTDLFDSTVFPPGFWDATATYNFRVTAFSLAQSVQSEIVDVSLLPSPPEITDVMITDPFDYGQDVTISFILEDTTRSLNSVEITVGEFELDTNGDPLLDVNGDPVYLQSETIYTSDLSANDPLLQSYSFDEIFNLFDVLSDNWVPNTLQWHAHGLYEFSVTAKDNYTQPTTVTENRVLYNPTAVISIDTIIKDDQTVIETLPSEAHFHGDVTDPVILTLTSDTPISGLNLLVNDGNGWVIVPSTDPTNLNGSSTDQLSFTYNYSLVGLAQGELQLGAVSMDSDTTEPSEFVTITIDNEVGLESGVNLFTNLDTFLVPPEVSDPVFEGDVTLQIDDPADYALIDLDDEYLLSFIDGSGSIVYAITCFWSNEECSFSSTDLSDGEYTLSLMASDLSIPDANMDTLDLGTIRVDNEVPSVTSLHLNNYLLENLIADPPPPPSIPVVEADSLSFILDASDVGTGIYTVHMTCNRDGDGGNDYIVFDETMTYPPGSAEISLSSMIDLSESGLGLYDCSLNIDDYNGHSFMGSYQFTLDDISIVPTPFIAGITISGAPLENNNVRVYAWANPLNTYQVEPEFIGVRFEYCRPENGVDCTSDSSWIDVGNATALDGGTITGGYFWEHDFSYATFFAENFVIDEPHAGDYLRAISYYDDGTMLFEESGPAIVASELFDQDNSELPDLDSLDELDLFVGDENNIVANSQNHPVIISVLQSDIGGSAADLLTTVETHWGSAGWSGSIPTTALPDTSYHNGEWTIWAFTPTTSGDFGNYQLVGAKKNLYGITNFDGTNGQVMTDGLMIDISQNQIGSGNAGTLYTLPVNNDWIMTQLNEMTAENLTDFVQLNISLNAVADNAQMQLGINYNIPGDYSIRNIETPDSGYPCTVTAGENVCSANIVIDSADFSKIYALFSNDDIITVADFEIIDGPDICFNNLSGAMVYFQSISVVGEGITPDFSWDFGDGSAPGSGESPSHNYTVAGIYTVTLTVTTPLAGSVSASHDLTILPLEDPQISFTSEGSTIFDDITFTASAVGYTCGGNEVVPVNLYWYFGDGNCEYGDTGPCGMGDYATHSYSCPGDYEVTLAAMVDEEAVAEVSNMITVDLPSDDLEVQFNGIPGSQNDYSTFPATIFYEVINPFSAGDITPSIDVMLNGLLIVNDSQEVGLDSIQFLPDRIVISNEDYLNWDMSDNDLQITAAVDLGCGLEPISASNSTTFVIDAQNPVVLTNNGFINQVATFTAEISDELSGIDLENSSLSLLGHSMCGGDSPCDPDSLTTIYLSSLNHVLDTDTYSYTIVLGDYLNPNQFANYGNIIIAHWDVVDMAGNPTQRYENCYLDMTVPYISPDDTWLSWLQAGPDSLNCESGVGADSGNHPFSSQNTALDLMMFSTGDITDLNVRLNLDHNNDEGLSNIALYLISPNGTSVELAHGSNSGNDGDADWSDGDFNTLSNTTFDDEAPLPISNGQAPFTGYFRPHDPLTAFNGQPITGVWQLVIFDNSPNSQSGIVDFSLIAEVCHNAYEGIVPAGTDVTVSFDYSDPFTSYGFDEYDNNFFGGSGIDCSSVVVVKNGELQQATDYYATCSSVSYNVGFLEPNTVYDISISVSDNVGNENTARTVFFSGTNDANLDCAGEVDGPNIYMNLYMDADGDGLGAGFPVELCVDPENIPVGWAFNGADVNDLIFCTVNYFDECGECGGNGPDTYYYDADGDGIGSGEGFAICSGDAPGNWVLITGDPFPDCPEDEANNLSGEPDCAGVCNGDNYIDECGTCDDDTTNDCEMDCLGVYGGATELDCAGVCGGESYEDDCGICDDDPSNDNIDMDCAGECFGPATVDQCGVCDDDPDNDNECLPLEVIDFHMYPNPAEEPGSFVIEVNKSYSSGNIQIFDFNGTLVDALVVDGSSSHRVSLDWTPQTSIPRGGYIAVLTLRNIDGSVSTKTKIAIF